MGGAFGTARDGAGRACERGGHEGLPVGQGAEDPRAESARGEARRRLRAGAERAGADAAPGAAAPGGGADAEGHAHRLRACGAAAGLERRIGRPDAVVPGDAQQARPGPPVSPGVPRPGSATPAAPLPRRLDVLPLTLTKDGRLANEAQVERLAKFAASATDCFIFCHGWLYDEAEARQDAARFFSVLDGVLAPLRERVVPLRVGLHWPSKPFADPGLTRGAPGGGLWPELERRMGTGSRRRHPANGSRGCAGDSDLALLRDLCATEIPGSPEEEAELDALGRRLAGAEREGGGLISPFRALSFWAMKRRAGDVGERLGRECLAPLWGWLSRAPRLHLVGHSFGAKLATSAVLGGARPESLTPLLGAFSAFAFAREIPRFDRPGFYHRVLAERLVRGPIVVLRSDHDTALATFYSTFIGNSEVGRRRDGAPGPGRRTLTEAVATSALGAVGARGVGAAELDLVDVQRTGIPEYPIVNVDGSRLARAKEAFVGAHRDIYHREVATLVAMAAGLLVGGPDGARPRPRDPVGNPRPGRPCRAGRTSGRPGGRTPGPSHRSTSASPSRSRTSTPPFASSTTGTWRPAPWRPRPPAGA